MGGEPMNNYPDDIRNYDHDPRSPFYEEPFCEDCELPGEDCQCYNRDEEE